MPTGYTYPVVDGKITKFSDFALSCARAFGALIEMRDEPMDAPIPDEFKPTSYHETALADAKQRLEELRAMTPEQASAEATAAYRKASEDRARWEAERQVENGRLQTMLDKTHEWQPPTADHVEMKKFMIEQLSMSMNGPISLPSPKELTGQAWLQDEIKSAMRNVEYHAAEHAKEIERVTGRTEWVKNLKASLPA